LPDLIGQPSGAGSELFGQHFEAFNMDSMLREFLANALVQATSCFAYWASKALRSASSTLGMLFRFRSSC